MYYSKRNTFPRMNKYTSPFSIIVFSLVLLICPFVYSQEGAVTAETKKMAADYRDKGLHYQKNGDMDTALMYFQKAIGLDPTLAVAYNDAGVIYEAKGWTDRAKQAYGRAIELDPTLPSPYYNMGSIYEREGDFDKAVYYYKQRVLVGDWNDEWTIKARQALQGLGVNDPNLKENYLDQQMVGELSKDDITGRPKGNDLDPKKRKRESRLRLMRGKQLYYMGQYQEALKELAAATTLDSKNKEANKLLEEVEKKVLFNE